MNWKKFSKEPLVHFALLAVLLFVADHLWSSLQKEKIVIDQETIDYLIKQREDLELRKLNPLEREETIDAFIEDEVLYKEAYKRGLDKGDSRMRRNLILKMRGLLTGDIELPTDEELRDYFESHREEFDIPATVSLEQIFFKDAAQVPTNLLEELRAGRDPATVGDASSRVGRSLPRMTKSNLVATLGPNAARAILDLSDERWHGPIESIHGAHFVRTVDRAPPRQASFEEVESYLKASWMMLKSRSTIEQEVDRLRSDYNVVIEGTWDQ